MSCRWRLWHTTFLTCMRCVGWKEGEKRGRRGRGAPIRRPAGRLSLKESRLEWHSLLWFGSGGLEVEVRTVSLRLSQIDMYWQGFRSASGGRVTCIYIRGRPIILSVALWPIVSVNCLTKTVPALTARFDILAKTHLFWPKTLSFGRNLLFWPK